MNFREKFGFLNSREMRLLLYFVQFGRCIWCGDMMTFDRKKNGGPARDFASFEHLQRKEDGGSFDVSNIVLAHSKCNLKRDREGKNHDRTLVDYQEDRP